jgi:DNA-binding CsgD family transcriptional regulator
MAASADDAFHHDLHARALQRRWRPDEDRLQLSAELALLGAETRNYDTYLERAAQLIALHSGGGCVVGLCDDDGSLYPLAVFHATPAANDALAGALMGKSFLPMRDLEDDVLAEGRGRRVEMVPEAFVERPGIARYIEITGHRWGVVVPLRVRGGSIGVLWISTARELRDDDVNFFEVVASRLALVVDHARFAEGDQTGRRPVDAGPAAELTEREREILALVAAGMTSREAADHLVVSVRTVEWHRARIQAKLGVSGRAMLTQIARDAGLVG